MIIEETELFDKEVLIGGDLGYANKARTKAITISDYGDGYRIRQYISNGDMNWQRTENIPMQLPVKPEIADDDDIIRATIKFIQLVGIEGAAKFIVNQNKSIDGLQKNNQSWVDCFRKNPEQFSV